MTKEIKTNAMRTLEKLNIAYELVDYDLDGEFTSAADIAEHSDSDFSYIYKTLATISNKGEIFIFVIPGEAHIDFKKASKFVGVKKLEMIHLKDLKSKVGYERGATTSLAMKKNFPVTIDESAQALPYIGISAGSIGYGLKINPFDLAKANGASFGDIIQ